MAMFQFIGRYWKWVVGFVVCGRFAAVERPSADILDQLLYMAELPVLIVLGGGLIGGVIGSTHGLKDLRGVAWKARADGFVAGGKEGLWVAVLLVFILGLVFPPNYCPVCANAWEAMLNLLKGVCAL